MVGIQNTNLRLCAFEYQKCQRGRMVSSCNGISISIKKKKKYGGKNSLFWGAGLFHPPRLAVHVGAHFALPAAEARKLKLQYQPVSPATALDQWGPAVLWAGRLVAQKRPELLAAVAGLLPHRRFELWAPGRGLEDWCDWGLELPNVHWCGAFTAVDQLPLERYGA